jgi:hypothetical protein
MTGDLWLGRRNADPDTDKETWCLVKAGDLMLSRRAAALPGQDLMQTVTWGEVMSSTRAGRFVRHSDLAASVAPNGSKASRRDAARLAAAPQIDLIDRCAVALAATPAAASILIAAVLAAAVDEPNLSTTWGPAAQRAIATGGEPAHVLRHRSVAQVLTGHMPTPEDVAAWLSLRLSAVRMRLYIAAGFTPVDAKAAEESGTYDEVGLTALAASPIPRRIA